MSLNLFKQHVVAATSQAYFYSSFNQVASANHPIHSLTRRTISYVPTLGCPYAGPRLTNTAEFNKV